MAGLLARKIEMTRVIKEDKFIPVTLLEIPKMQVLGYKTFEKDGYSAVIIGIVKRDEVKHKKGKHTLSPKDFSAVKEFHIDGSQEGEKEVGSVIGFDELEGKETVGISGTSK